MANISYSYDSGRPSRKSSGGGVVLFIFVLAAIGLIAAGIVLWVRSCSAAEAVSEVASASAPGVGSRAQELCRSVLDEMDREIAATHFVKARDAALKALDDPAIRRGGEEYRAIGKKLGEVNIHILNQGLPCDKLTMHTVKSGDSLSRIAGIYNLPVPTLQRANNIRGANIQVGQVLKVYQAKFSIEVDKSEHLLYVFDDGKLFRLYDIGIGRENRTPAGEFKLVDKIAEPDWDGPNGRIPYQGEGNILGTRWLKLEPVGDKSLTGYGIHGTWDVGSITQDMSNGCVRMHNKEVEELFDYIPRQTPVRIFE